MKLLKLAANSPIYPAKVQPDLDCNAGFHKCYQPGVTSPGKGDKLRMSHVCSGERDWEKLARDATYKPAKMATLCAMSERQLQRIFKKSFGCTPRVWLRNLQCQTAKDLIAHGYSTKAAAAELNFATEAHFCREFKKVFGASPQSFAPNHLSLRSETGLASLRPASEFAA